MEAVSGSDLTVQQGVPVDIDTWSNEVWAAAMAGDPELITAYLSAIPDTDQPARAQRLREAVESYNSHIDAASTDRTADREAALERLSELFAEEKVVEALTAAVELQTLSDNWDEVLALEELNQLRVRAEGDWKTAFETGDLLLAQDLLYRLRTLHEDIGELSLIHI